MADHSSLGSFIIQNHRGAGDSAAENTLEAFEFSWNRGMAPEADLRTTRDGVIVPFHDHDFSRVVRGVGPELASRGVEDLTWEQLVQLDIGGERFFDKHVSKLSDVFERMRKPSLTPAGTDRCLYMDIKQVDLGQLADLVNAHGVRDQVIFTSSDYELIRQWKRLAPWGKTMIWMGLVGQAPSTAQRIERLRAADFADLTQLQTHIHFRKGAGLDDADPFTLPDRFITELSRELERHDILYQAIPWRIDDPAVYRRLLDLGVKSFATDFPEVALDVVRQYLRASS